MINFIQVLLSILIIILILIQQRGATGGALFGSQSEIFLKRRGLEKKIYILTWVLIAIFIFISILRIKQW